MAEKASKKFILGIITGVISTFLGTIAVTYYQNNFMKESEDVSAQSTLNNTHSKQNESTTSNSSTNSTLIKSNTTDGMNTENNLKDTSQDIYMSYTIKHFRENDNNLAFANYNYEMVVQGIPYYNGIQFGNMFAFDRDFFEYNLQGKYKKIVGKIAIDDKGTNSSNMIVEFFGDDKLIRSYTLIDGKAPQDLYLIVSNIKILKVVINSINKNASRKVDIIEPVLIK